jgi:hypothetical protein
MGKIIVVKPFTYYIDGYQRRDFVIGEHDVPYDCAAFAEQYGFAKVEGKDKTATEEDNEEEEKVKNDAGTNKSSRSKKASAS